MHLIRPYSSAGDFIFGATYSDVVSLLGEPRLKEKSRLGETVVRYDGFGATISTQGVVEAYFLPEINVWVSGIQVFHNPSSACISSGDISA